MARYLSGLVYTIKNKIGMHMVFSVQEAKNLAIKVELLVQEQTSSYRGYWGVDDKAPDDKKKTSSCVCYYGECQCWCGRREKCSSRRRKG